MPIVIDGVIFQMQKERPHGIGRLWHSLLRELSGLPIGRDLLLLDRDGTAPAVAGIRTRRTPPYSLRDPQAQAQALDGICRQESAELFLSTFFSSTIETPSLLMLYDMIAEHLAGERTSGADLGAMVRQLELLSKKVAIQRASGFLSISRATASAFAQFYPRERRKPLSVVPCAAAEEFHPHAADEIAAFRRRHEIHRPYFLLVGRRGGYKNARLFLEALARVPGRERFEVLMAGGEPELDAESRRCLSANPWRVVYLSDRDLSLAYGGALALVYPSLMEGFGLPVLEAMRCGCPVVACRVSSLPEVAGDAALYLERPEPENMRRALELVQEPEVRQGLIARGREQAARFSWRESALRFARAVEAMRGTGGPQSPGVQPAAGARSIEVSAIVATYAAEKFMRGCLQDLVDQSLFASGRMEIIVVDSASPEREGDIVREFQARYPNIVYLRSEARETVYRAWNRGIGAARGKYLTNANTDDRHCRVALERMRDALERRPEAVLVYADVEKTQIPNETFERHTPAGRFRWYDWDRRRLLALGCFIGPQPMWRRSVHEIYGGFDEDLVTSGDFEFWLRISQTFDFFHIREPLGLYLVNPDSIEHRNAGLKKAEDARIVTLYREAASKGEIIRRLSPLNLPRPIDFDPIPPELRPDFAGFLLSGTGLFRKPGEVELYFESVDRLTERLHAEIRSRPESPETWKLARVYAQQANFLPLYFARANLRALSVRRAAIVEFATRVNGHALPCPPRPLRAGRSRLRLGVYSRCLREGTEAFAALPVFEFLDREAFEIHVFVHAESGDRAEAIARRSADSFTVLPEATKPSVQALRSRSLDVLFFANNLTAVANAGSVLANYRMAPVQCVHFANPITTGKPTIDAFLLGRLAGGAEDPQRFFSERILPIEGSGICFRLPETAADSAGGTARGDLGIGSDRVVYLSGANCFKIIPELRETWARVLAEVPDSVLVLYPFGPAWADRYPRQAFVDDFARVFLRHGISAERLRVLDTLAGRAEVLGLNRMADVYLDAVPYNGATSLVDPLAAGTPPVVADGGELRFSQGAALLRELGCPELIARDEADYVRLAVRLGRDPAFRETARRRVRAQMAAGADFLNPRLYARRISEALHYLGSLPPQEVRP